MNAAAILALISELYSSVTALTQERDALVAERDLLVARLNESGSRISSP